MRSKNLTFIAILATVLLSGVFTSFAAATDEKNPDRIVAPDSSDISDTGPAPDHNATTNADDETIYYILQNQTITDDTIVPGTEDANLIATNTGSPDNTLAFIAIAALSVIIVGGAIGVVYYRRSTAKEPI